MCGSLRMVYKQNSFVVIAEIQVLHNIIQVGKTTNIEI
jgi:hypothetical protein